MTTMTIFTDTIARMNAEFCAGTRENPPKVIRAYDVSKAPPGYKLAAKFSRSGAMTLLAYW